MRLAERIDALYRSFPVDDAMRVLESLCGCARYQASRGIEKAADLVAASAEEAGLAQVGITYYEASNAPTWWTFSSPRAWTPISASLALESADRLVPIARFPTDAMCLATYSAPQTDADSIPLYLLEDLSRAESFRAQGALIVLGSGMQNVGAAIRWAEHAGCKGVVADPLSSVRARRNLVEERGRLELSPRSPLFAFSLLPRELALLERAARAGRRARVRVDARETGRMPLVQGVLPGTEGHAASAEILVQAHLCHPSPGANDNASGVAASLAVAKLLASRRRRSSDQGRPVRFVFGPEFVGTAAYLHDFVFNGPRRRIGAAINLDMVGEDQSRCRSALILEEPADHVPSCIGALAERCLELLPPDAMSYSGAVPVSQWNWRSTPFAGASDHSLFADRACSVPAIQLSHFPDRFNHTSGDTLDKVSTRELQRSATVAAACAEILASANSSDTPTLQRITAFSVARRLAAIAQHDVRDVNPATLDPYCEDQIAGLTDHVLRVGQQQIASVVGVTGESAASESKALSEWLRREAESCSALALGWLPSRAVMSGPSIRKCWNGPFNLRGLLAALAPTAAAPFREAIERDRTAYPRLLGLALAIDNESSRFEVLRRAAYASRLEMPLEMANGFLDALMHAGWASER